MKTKVLLVGWDAADWRIINPLLKQGKLPALARLMHNGAWGNLATIDPPISPMLWTSIATGKRPYKHGIHGFTELAPDGETVRPVRVTERKCQAVWNILNANGLKTNVVGWWPSHPAEQLDGCCISNFFAVTPEKDQADWPLPKGSIHPKNMEEELTDLRLHPRELTPEIMASFFPDAKNLISDNDGVLRSAMRILAHATSVHAVATHIIESTDWDFMAVYYDALDHFSHLGMKYHPPKLKGISDTDFKNYHYIVEAAYRFHDMMLDRLMDLAGEDCNVILVSDHGFESGNKRMISLPEEPGAPALEHRPYGIFVGSGPDLKGGQIFGASLLDITPTVLNLFQLKTAEDMDGRSLQSAVKQHDIGFVKSYELNKKVTSIYNESTQIDKELVRQLEALGYINSPKTKQEKKTLLSENEYYLARSFADGGKFDEAFAISKELTQAYPDIERYSNFHCSLLLRKGQLEELEEMLSEIADTPYKSYLTGLIYLQKGKPQLASQVFESLIGMTDSNILTKTSVAWLQSGNIEKAKEAAERAVKLDDDNLEALNTLGEIAMKKEEWEDALSSFFKSLNLIYYQPAIHEKVGQCLTWMNLPKEAAQALELSLQMKPGKISVIQQLKEMYSSSLSNPERLAELEEKQTKAAIVVTGFPRTGTSLMMQILRQSGMEILSDGERSSDEFNPEGYFELEAVKNTVADQSYLLEASNKAIKIVMPLLRFVKPVIPLKVIWMTRDMSSIVKSQENMIGASKNAISQSLVVKMNTEIELMYNWLNQHPQISYVSFSYSDVLSSPQKTARKLSAFLEKPIKEDVVKSVVKPNLRHF